MLSSMHSTLWDRQQTQADGDIGNAGVWQGDSAFDSVKLCL